LFFFSSRRRHTRSKRDWSSDVCSSDLIKSIQAAIWDLNKLQALPEIKLLEQIKSESLGENRMRTVLLGTFAGLALLLSAVGVYRSEERRVGKECRLRWCACG